MQKFNLAVVMMVLGTLAITPKAEARNLFRNQPRIASVVTAQVPDSTDTNDASIYLKRGFKRLEENNYQEAIADFNQVIKLEPNNSDAYLGRGLGNFSLENYQAAKENFDQALKISPDFAYGYYFRGFTRFMLEDKSGAIADLRQASTLFTQEGELEFAQRADSVIEKIQEG
ncbi:tetratricopeptide repeat protein [Nodularia sp. NIES-3585]|uniref:tetratricopeptide repeat protein n=1 Tax=Nodularia sp. NIES-3585 TaxID=1973477 RepID=UPI000B5CCFF6|nr:tetratricopeptide repeat protein [Nodularia sp. NIES-3585]GAX37353.1 TPR repeat-containing protein [Nodularia sp. NIES-3585]